MHHCDTMNNHEYTKDCQIEEKEYAKTLFRIIRQNQCIQCKEDVNLDTCIRNNTTSEMKSKFEGLKWEDLSFQISLTCVSNEQSPCTAYLHSVCLFNWFTDHCRKDIICPSCRNPIMEYWIFDIGMTNIRKWELIMFLTMHNHKVLFQELSGLKYDEQFPERPLRLYYRVDEQNQIMQFTVPEKVSYIQFCKIMIEESTDTYIYLKNLRESRSKNMNKNMSNAYIQPECQFCQVTENKDGCDDPNCDIQHSLEYYTFKCQQRDDTQPEILHILAHPKCVNEYLHSLERNCIICGNFARSLFEHTSQGAYISYVSDFTQLVWIKQMTHELQSNNIISHVIQPPQEWIEQMANNVRREDASDIINVFNVARTADIEYKFNANSHKRRNLIYYENYLAMWLDIINELSIRGIYQICDSVKALDDEFMED